MNDMLVRVARARAEFTALSRAAEAGVRLQYQPTGTVKATVRKTGTVLKLSREQYGNFLALVQTVR